MAGGASQGRPDEVQAVSLIPEERQGVDHEWAIQVLRRFDPEARRRRANVTTNRDRERARRRQIVEVKRVYERIGCAPGANARSDARLV